MPDNPAYVSEREGLFAALANPTPQELAALVRVAGLDCLSVPDDYVEAFFRRIFLAATVLPEHRAAELGTLAAEFAIEHFPDSAAQRFLDLVNEEKGNVA